MEITEKFNLKSKALIIILITLLITGISTMSYAAMPRFPSLAGGNITEIFSGAFEKILARGMAYMDQLKAGGSGIDFNGGVLSIKINDGQNVNFNAALGLMDKEGEKVFGAEVKELELKVGEMTLVGVKDAKGDISFDLEDGIVVNANTGAGIKLINDKVVIDAEALADAKIVPTNEGFQLVTGAGGYVTINGMATLAGDRVDNEVKVDVDLAGEDVDVHIKGGQTVAVEGLVEEETFKEEVKIEDNANGEKELNLNVQMGEGEEAITIIDKSKAKLNLTKIFNTVMTKLSGLRDGFGAMFNR